jgi:hypothetical protein
MAVSFTPKQGQYLVFTYYYTKINRVPPAEIDVKRYLQASPPAFHEMVKTLHSRSTRVVARSRAGTNHQTHLPRAACTSLVSGETGLAIPVCFGALFGVKNLQDRSPLNSFA